MSSQEIKELKGEIRKLRKSRTQAPIWLQIIISIAILVPLFPQQESALHLIFNDPQRAFSIIVSFWSNFLNS